MVIFQLIKKKLLKKIYDNKLTNIDQYLKKNLKENILIFDVGAHKGESVIRFKNIFPEAEIHAFEPVYNSYKILKKNFFNFNKMFFINSLVSNNNKKHKLFIYNKTELSSLFKIKNKNFKTKFIKAIKLDDYSIKNKINHIDLLKIDTQGSELKILNGCKNLLKNKKISYIEVEIIFKNNENKYYSYLSFSEIEKLLFKYNFNLVKLDGIGEYKDLSISQINALYKMQI